MLTDGYGALPPFLLSPTGGTNRDQSVTASGRIEIGTMLANRP